METKTKEKAAKHTFTLNGTEYTRNSPRTYTHIVIGDDVPCRADCQHSEWCRRTGLQLGWSQSFQNAEKMASSMRSRGFRNVTVYPVTRA